MTLVPEIRDQLTAAAQRRANAAGRTRRRERWQGRLGGLVAIAASTLSVAAVLVVVLLAGPHAPSDRKATQTTPHHASPPVTGVPTQHLRHARRPRGLPATIYKHLALFRTSRRGQAEKLPAQFAVQFKQMDRGERGGLDLSLARDVHTPEGPVWIVPGSQWICHFGAGSGGCFPIAKLATLPNEFLTWSYTTSRGPTIMVTGIAPDDVLRIDAVLQTGKAIPVPIQSNVVGSHLPTTVIKLRFQTSDLGTLTIPVNTKLPGLPHIRTHLSGH